MGEYKWTTNQETRYMLEDTNTVVTLISKELC